MTMAGIGRDRALWLARHVLPHEPGLRAQLARWRLPDDLEADDIVQECYSRVAALESVEGIRNPRAYFYSIAHRTILMHVRHSRVVSIRSVDDFDSYELPADEPSPEEQVSDREQLHLLALAVAKLPEPGRRAFLLRVVEELPHREIGNRLGLSDNAVQKSVAKSLKLLGDLLGRGGSGQPRASSGTMQSKELNNDQARDERGD